MHIRDIARCPYVPSQPEYTEWDENDKRRCQEIVDRRQRLYLRAMHLRFHPDPDVSELAWFYLNLFKD